uniref:Cholesterol side-chain cleavage enzyme, mitochondrial n=1 Tax=Timema tahoe TaxID=61484 RepID=A0A7R9P042_9NEOP|nr:unnamed protein product [Timema tahoe]
MIRATEVLPIERIEESYLCDMTYAVYNFRKGDAVAVLSRPPTPFQAPHHPLQPLTTPQPLPPPPESPAYPPPECLPTIHQSTQSQSHPRDHQKLSRSGRDGKHFPEPDVFKPERWCRNQAGTYRGVENPYASLPFAMGARSCVGRKIAESQILLTLAEPCENNSHTGTSTDTEEQNTAVDNFPKLKPKSPPLKPSPTKEKKLSQLSSMVTLVWKLLTLHKKRMGLRFSVVKRFKLSLVDTQPVEMVLELVAVPSKPIRLHLTKRWQLCNERTAGVEDANSSHCAAPMTSHKQCTYHRGQFCRCCMMMPTTHTTQSNSTSDSPGTVLPVATAAAFYGFELHWAHSVD